jgi:8-oxo-dGTP diphosphatase
MDILIKRKAFAYITYEQRLLVFRHVGMSEAGIQVPAGTIEPGETPKSAALSEAWEETGLADLTLVSYLGEQLRDMRDMGKAELHHRFFYHVRCTHQPPRQWRHTEMHSSESGERPIFELFWVDLPDGIPPLIAGHGALLPMLHT